VPSATANQQSVLYETTEAQSGHDAPESIAMTSLQAADSQYHLAAATLVNHVQPGAEAAASTDAQYHLAAATPPAAAAGAADYRTAPGPGPAGAALPHDSDYALPEGYLTMGNAGDSSSSSGGNAGRFSMMSETSFGLSNQGSFRVTSVRRVNPIRTESDVPTPMGLVVEEEDADVGGGEAGAARPAGSKHDPAALPRMERRTSLADEEGMMFVTRVSDGSKPPTMSSPGAESAGNDPDLIGGTRAVDDNAFVRSSGGGLRLASIRKQKAMQVAEETETVGAASMEVVAEA
jgi:hypothetical protein